MTQMKQEKLKSPLILASSSPRRISILKSLHIEFSVRKSQIDERKQKDEDPESFAVRMAEEKASQVGTLLNMGIVIGCDTIVTLNGKIFGKPESHQNAAAVLRVLSGKWHNVISGLSLYNAEDGQKVSGCRVTAVKFLPISKDEIAWYVDSGEPMDKAGSYGIQGFGMMFIEKIIGSYTNVVGLPVELLKELLGEMRVDFLSLIRRPF